MFKDVWSQIQDMGDKVALNACEDKVVFLTYWRPMMVTPFLRPCWKPKLSYSPFVHDFTQSLYTVLTMGQRSIVLLARNAPGSPDPTSPALSDPRYADYKFVVDPNSLEVGDHVVVPSQNVWPV